MKSEGGYLYVMAKGCYVLAIDYPYLIYKGNTAIYLPGSYSGGVGIESDKAGFKLFTIK